MSLIRDVDVRKCVCDDELKNKKRKIGHEIDLIYITNTQVLSIYKLQIHVLNLLKSCISTTISKDPQLYFLKIEILQIHTTHPQDECSRMTRFTLGTCLQRIKKGYLIKISPRFLENCPSMYSSVLASCRQQREIVINFACHFISNRYLAI